MVRFALLPNVTLFQGIAERSERGLSKMHYCLLIYPSLGDMIVKLKAAAKRENLSLWTLISPKKGRGAISKLWAVLSPCRVCRDSGALGHVG